MRKVPVAITLLLAVAAMAGAQSATVRVESVACVPLDGNAVVKATVAPEVSGATVRIYFRRMSIEVEDWYYVEARPAGGGLYWAVTPVPTDAENVRKDLSKGNQLPSELAWAEWWTKKDGSQDRDPNGDLDKDVIREKATIGKVEKRSWIYALDPKALQKFLEKQKYEPAEFHAAVVDPSGRTLAESPVVVAPVNGECRVELTPQEQGVADNLVVGEIAPWQKGKEPFHWECDGIVSRYDPQYVLRNDTACRACAIIAWWPKGIVPAAILTTVGIVTIGEPSPEPSPARP